MTEITVRLLDESEWSMYRDVRLRALAESPGSFTATLAEEADRDEQFWRDRMTRSHRLLAERGPVPEGIVSLGPYEQEPSAAEVFGLYVVPEARSTGISWRLVDAAADLATQSPTPPWRRTRPAGSQSPAKAPSAETRPNSRLRPARVLCPGGGGSTS
jgi:GNAT superfamily N-acetyltransferase